MYPSSFLSKEEKTKIEFRTKISGNKRVRMKGDIRLDELGRAFLDESVTTFSAMVTLVIAQLVAETPLKVFAGHNWCLFRTSCIT